MMITTSSWLAGYGRTRCIAAGEYIIREGDEGSSLYYILSGGVLVLQTEMGEAPVAELGAGQLFGEMAALTGGRRSASVVATAACQVLELPAEQLREAFGREPELREQLGRLGVARAEANLELLREAA
jgi:Na+:H+ antiporter